MWRLRRKLVDTEDCGCFTQTDMCPRQKEQKTSRELQPTGQRERRLALKAKYSKLKAGSRSKPSMNIDIRRMNTIGTLI